MPWKAPLVAKFTSNNPASTSLPCEAVSAIDTQITDSDDIPPALRELCFCYPLRRYQQEILELVKIKMERGERQLHIVAPPGAGKTIIGLQLISTLKVPALILAPNTTIQSQWGLKLDLFIPDHLKGILSLSDILGTHEDKPLKPVTVLTYQVLSTPGNEQEYLEKLAHQNWAQEIAKGRSISTGEAELRILDLMQNNEAAYNREMSRHVSRLRKKLADVMDLKDVLHKNAFELLQALRRQKVRLVLFDECHHLTDYWAAIMSLLVKHLDDPIIVGLTGTPPEGKTKTQENRYLSLVGEIDYQVPTPALVKEGGLAPFQDLVLFTQPTEKEFHFLESQHIDFHRLIADLAGIEQPTHHYDYDDNDLAAHEEMPKSDEVPLELHDPSVLAFVDDFEEDVVHGVVSGGDMDFSPPGEGHAGVIDNSAKHIETANENLMVSSAGETQAPPLTEWVLRRLDETVYDKDTGAFKSLVQLRPQFAVALYRFLSKTGRALPKNIRISQEVLQSPTIDDWMMILEDFASHRLKVSQNKKDHELYEQVRTSMRKLGYAITEQGLRKTASPIDRVLAFSRSKPHAVCRILDTEYASLQDRLRAVVVTDFERMSATSVKSLKGVLDAEAGGAIATLRTLLAAPISAVINPCLVTGSLVLVDRRIKDQFIKVFDQCLKRDGHDVQLIADDNEQEPFVEITANTSSWQSRLYVAVATEIFELGITKCLIGTRGLFGEGWDSQSLNTLIDLTTTTSPVSVKQLRGRSLRIHTKDPMGGRKVANNWDVICIAPALEKGLNDYHRFVRKHDGFYGISDDGQIECGVGHVHPSFSELTPAEVFASAADLNNEMLKRSLVRDQIYELWNVGKPYHNRTLGCVELTALRKLNLTPAYLKRNVNYKVHSKEMREALSGIYIEHTALGGVAALATFGGAAFLHVPVLLAVLPFAFALYLAFKRHKHLFTSFQEQVCEPGTIESSLDDMAAALLSALKRVRQLPNYVKRESIKISRRSDGSYRIFLDDVEPAHSKVFTAAFKELMSPVGDQPYLIPKYEFALPYVDGDSQSKDSEKRKRLFFKTYLRGSAKPRIATYHIVPKLLARSQKGRDAFQDAWNKYVSPGFIVETAAKPEVSEKYFGMGPSLAERLLWE
ncbi:MAG: hypothetical protein C0507_22635 [Cyanobacteria bacterium PR.3.49]|nr:hypothetical protein [Cyanobacteria bacterium PR.3.49]